MLLGLRTGHGPLLHVVGSVLRRLESSRNSLRGTPVAGRSVVRQRPLSIDGEPSTGMRVDGRGTRRRPYDRLRRSVAALRSTITISSRKRSEANALTALDT